MGSLDPGSSTYVEQDVVNQRPVLQDEIRVASNDAQRKLVLELYSRATSEYQSVDLWVGKLELASTLLQESEVANVILIEEESL